MLAFGGCTHGLSSDEADELTLIRENTPLSCRLFHRKK
ncbi:hypothetical protein C5167_003903 [Papaver somniferum]|uniref:Uncharacterized protein n=1 Tax=Papaver somniferum TaxID=3469 RepID=A0A4Y7L0X8_PAPSO|nr:hypothetical protein C5167_003903 [Papaver somniferum]